MRRGAARTPHGLLRRGLRRHVGAVLLAIICGAVVGGGAQDTASGTTNNAAGRNLSEQELAGEVDAVEQCAMERSKLHEERAKFETAQELLSIKDESMQDLIARNRELEIAAFEADQARRALEAQLRKVTAVNVTGALSRELTFQFAERLAADAMHTEPDATKVMDMAYSLLEVLQGATGDAVAKENAAARIAANSGHGERGATRGGEGGKLLEAADRSAEPDRWKMSGGSEGPSSAEREEIFSKPVIRKLREEVREMFYDSFDSYMQHAYPYDELRPLTCSRKNVFGPKGYALTLIDSLDTLAVLGDLQRFDAGVRRVIEEVSFDVDVNVSVFETNIRAVGGLLSAHFLALRFLPWYSGELLKMCIDLADR